jgi:hypothetical protein
MLPVGSELLREPLEASFCQCSLRSAVYSRCHCSVQSLICGSEVVHIVHIREYDPVMSIEWICSLQCMVEPTGATSFQGAAKLQLHQPLKQTRMSVDS